MVRRDDYPAGSRPAGFSLPKRNGPQRVPRAEAANPMGRAFSRLGAGALEPEAGIRFLAAPEVPSMVSQF
jgi:hypothetical protein